MLIKKIILISLACVPIVGILLVGWLAPIRLLNALSPRQIIIDKDIAYTNGDHRLQLDVYRPEDTPGEVSPTHSSSTSTAKKQPIVVFFYGGSWNNGARADYRFVGAAFAARGLIAVIPDYRLYPEVRYPQFLQDCAAAVAWTIREAPRYGGDPQRVYVMGHSAGAYNAAMLALDPRWLAEQGLQPAQLKGWIGLAGPYDFLPSNNPDVQPVFNHPHYPVDAEPINFAQHSSLPAFIGAAASDNLVDPQRNSLQLAQLLTAAGAPVTVKIYSGVGHITLLGAWAWPLRGLAPVFTDVMNFLPRD